MDFDLSEEQRLISDSVARLMKERYGFEQRKAYRKNPLGFSEEIWRQYAELGLLGASFAEEDGGFGGGAVEIMLMQEAFGRALAVEPYVATVVLAGGALRHGASDKQRRALIGAIVEGELRISLAHAERASGWNLFDVAATARKDGASYVLSGEKGLVLHGDSAQKLIVLARTSGGRRDKGGLGLFLVDASASGVARRGYETQDGQRAAEIGLINVRVDAENVIGDPEGAGPVIERTIDEAIAALAAESVGAMSEAIEVTTEYLKTRKQFGVPIGSFQALQHRAADMVVALEQARSMMYFATMMARESDESSRAQGDIGGKSPDRTVGKIHRAAGDAAARRHRDDLRI